MHGITPDALAFVAGVIFLICFAVIAVWLLGR